MVLTTRDFLILNELERWRFCLGRHIKELAGFGSESACYRRLKKLIESGYIKRSYVLYGVPAIYQTSYKGKQLLGANKRLDKVNPSQLVHEIAVLDTCLFLVEWFGIPASEIKTEKQLHQSDGFSNRNHHPDMTFTHEDKTYCVEVELTNKAKNTFLKNLESNYISYDKQIWILPVGNLRNRKLIEESGFTDIEVFSLEDVR